MVVNIREVTDHKYDPPVKLWLVEVDSEGGKWQETYGSEAEARAFDRGVRAAVTVFGKLADYSFSWSS